MGKETAGAVVAIVVAALFGYAAYSVKSRSEVGESTSLGSKQTKSELVETAARTTEDPFGPPRSVFRCERPTVCDGPGYVTFNSYMNNPAVGDERQFFAVSPSPGAQVQDSVWLDKSSSELVFRLSIDNNTYQENRSPLYLIAPSTDAVDTRVRVRLPARPIYRQRLIAFLSARNATPGTVWDTATINSPFPVQLTYVKGSTRIDRRIEDRRPETGILPPVTSRHFPDGITTANGLRIGNWKADFLYSGFVTFRVKVMRVPEPVRDPTLTSGISSVGVRNLPPSDSGLQVEPKRDGDAGPRFRCERTHCDGPPYLALNVYENHPLLRDESDFLRAADAGGYGGTGTEEFKTVSVVSPGDVLKVRLAIDNGADPNAIGSPTLSSLTAREVLASVFVPRGKSSELRLLATVRSRNAEPRQITDTLPIRSRVPIRVRVNPRSIGILQSGRLRRGSGALIDRGGSRPIEDGLRIGNIPPSFSQVAYVEFYLTVDR